MNGTTSMTFSLSFFTFIFSTLFYLFICLFDLDFFFFPQSSIVAPLLSWWKPLTRKEPKLVARRKGDEQVLLIKSLLNESSFFVQALVDCLLFPSFFFTRFSLSLFVVSSLFFSIKGIEAVCLAYFYFIFIFLFFFGLWKKKKRRKRKKKKKKVQWSAKTPASKHLVQLYVDALAMPRSSHTLKKIQHSIATC
jgi:hypothetical protein